MVEIDVHHTVGDFTLDARWSAGRGTTALLGRSGAGKTTLVNVLAGLIRPMRARVVVDGQVWIDTDARIDVPAHRRRVGVVFQEGRLFPHLSVAQNLRYGSVRAGIEAADARAMQARVVEMLGIGALLHRRPRGLSGGEKQRVALGRALLMRPALLLMDEPLAALDEPRKAEILPYIERLRDETRVPIVYVSHSIAEVVRLADTVVILDRGTVAAAGPTGDVMARVDLFPLTGRAEAGAVLDGRVERHDDEAGLTLLETPAGTLRMPRADLALGQPVRLRIRARDVMLATERPHGLSALNVLAGTVEAVGSPTHAIVDVRVACGTSPHAPIVARITRHSVQRLGLAPGVQVYAIVKGIAFDRRSIAPGVEIDG